MAREYVVWKYYDYEGHHEVFAGSKVECKKYLTSLGEKDLKDCEICFRGPSVEEFLA